VITWPGSPLLRTPAATAAAALFGRRRRRVLLEQKRAGRRVAAYGAAAKGNTLLNYAGVKPDLLPRVCDAASAKQGKYLPGSHIPILPPDSLRLDQPDFVLVLPWNLAQEVRQQLAYLSAQSVRFVTVIPELTIQ
jgi:ABC-type hemin transport system substrate-binding protein